MSSLSNLVLCPAFFALRRAKVDGVSSAKAQTGSAAGRVVELWTRGLPLADALAEVRATPDYDLADHEQVERRVSAYTLDPRNDSVVLVDSLELEVRLTEPLPLVGHVDQVRRNPITQQLEVWDVKNGSPGGIELLHSAAWQLAAYALGATEHYDEPVLPGGIIRLAGYTPRGGVDPGEAQVFFGGGWTLPQCRVMLDSAAFLLEMLTRGEYLTLPGRHCSWCPAFGPHHCPDFLEETL